MSIIFIGAGGHLVRSDPRLFDHKEGREGGKNAAMGGHLMVKKRAWEKDRATF